MPFEGLGSQLYHGTPWKSVRVQFVTITTSALPIPGGVGNLANRRGVWLFNGTGTIFLGFANTITATDEEFMRLSPRQERIYALDENTTLYGIVSSGTAKLVVLEYV